MLSPSEINDKIFRGNRPPERLLEMRAHCGSCAHCGGTIKMERFSTRPYALRPDRCRCWKCGQSYFMEIENIDEWELEQWKQKDAKA